MGNTKPTRVTMSSVWACSSLGLASFRPSYVQEKFTFWPWQNTCSLQKKVMETNGLTANKHALDVSM